MKLQTLFIIAVLALFGALGVATVRAEPGDGTDARPGADRPADARIVDVCSDVAELCNDGGQFCRTHAELCRRIAQFCNENPDSCRTFVQFCRTHQQLCERLIEYCQTNDVRCRGLIAKCVESPARCRYFINCFVHPDRCHDRPADRPARDVRPDSSHPVRPLVDVAP